MVETRSAVFFGHVDGNTQGIATMSFKLPTWGCCWGHADEFEDQITGNLWSRHCDGETCRFLSSNIIKTLRASRLIERQQYWEMISLRTKMNM